MLVEFLNYSATIARNLGSSPNRGGVFVYYARHRVGKGGLVLAPAATRVQVLRSQDFLILINRSYRAFEGRKWYQILRIVLGRQG